MTKLIKSSWASFYRWWSTPLSKEIAMAKATYERKLLQQEMDLIELSHNLSVTQEKIALLSQRMEME